MESGYTTFALKPTAPQMLESTAPAPASSPAPAPAPPQALGWKEILAIALCIFVGGCMFIAGMVAWLKYRNRYVFLDSASG